MASTRLQPRGGKSIRKPALVAHADWSKDPKKRWCAAAVLEADGHYLVDAPRMVGCLSSYFRRLRGNLEADAAVLAGFDFPIGLPARYAAKVGLTDFVDALPGFGRGEWDDFYCPAPSRSCISTSRPFYPAGSTGGTKKQHLVEALGLAGDDDLRRRCELSANAQSLFWLVGAKQVGRAAISGWRDLLAPALANNGELSIWPFDGPLFDLVARPGIVVAETYPAAMYRRLRLEIRQSNRKKTSRSDRANDAPRIRDWADSRNVRLESGLENELGDGFGSDRSGDDRFDAVVGLFGMLDVVLGNLPSGEPRDDTTQVEGWILGHSAP